MHDGESCKCFACTIRRELEKAFGPVGFNPVPPPKPVSFVELADQVEGVLRDHERNILKLEQFGRPSYLPDTEPGCDGLKAIILSIAKHELEAKRSLVKKFRALLAEEIGRRVVETEKDGAR